MCEKAVEIQDSHRKDELDIFFHDGCVKTIASKLPGCRGVNHIIERVEFRYVSDIRPKEWNDYCIWLPTQAQLQGLLNKDSYYKFLPTLVNMFNLYVKSIPRKQYSPDGWTNLSMESLWLAFVMSELYSKQWNGKDWEKN